LSAPSGHADLVGLGMDPLTRPYQISNFIGVQYVVMMLYEFPRIDVHSIVTPELFNVRLITRKQSCHRSINFVNEPLVDTFLTSTVTHSERSAYQSTTWRLIDTQRGRFLIQIANHLPTN